MFMFFLAAALNPAHSGESCRKLCAGGLGDRPIARNCDCDRDGVLNRLDCAIFDRNIYPGAAEIIGNGLDDDCDPATPDNVGPIPEYYHYADQDGDGYGDPNNFLVDQDPVNPAGYVSSADDCDDTNDRFNPAALDLPGDALDRNCDGRILCFVDADGDGARDSTVVSSSGNDCRGPGEARIGQALDCDDTRADINPDALELCDGLDNDCDALVDVDDPSVTDALTGYPDLDFDGFGDSTNPFMACTVMPPEYLVDGSDCDDTRADINPDGIEVCDPDDLDEDCDGGADDLDSNVSEKPVYFQDLDGDNFGNPYVDWATCDEVPPIGYTVADLNADGDPHNDPTDCNDTQAAINPDAFERCDGIDNDCDLLVDEGFCP